jgi:L-methionine (R)-S-oxide reductase
MDVDALVEEIRRTTAAGGDVEEQAAQIAQLVRTRTGRRWVGIYRVTRTDVENLAWSGPAPPAHPTFAIGDGLTSAAIATRRAVVSNDVASDSRYLTNQESTGSELIVPVLDGDGIAVGTLDIEAAERDAFDEQDVAFFERLAAALAGLFRV